MNGSMFAALIGMVEVQLYPTLNIIGEHVIGVHYSPYDVYPWSERIDRNFENRFFFNEEDAEKFVRDVLDSITHDYAFKVKYGNRDTIRPMLLELVGM